MVKVEMLDKAIQAQETLVEHVLKYTIGEESLRPEDVGENLEGALEALRVKVKALIMRDFLASNNMLGDGFIGALYNGDKEEVDSIMARVETTQKFILDVLKEHEVISNLMIKEVNDEVAKINEAREIGEGGDSANSSFSNDADSGTTAEPTEGGDNSDPFGAGGDAGGEQAPAEGGEQAPADDADPFA